MSIRVGETWGVGTETNCWYADRWVNQMLVGVYINFFFYPFVCYLHLLFFFKAQFKLYKCFIGVILLVHDLVRYKSTIFIYTECTYFCHFFLDKAVWQTGISNINRFFVRKSKEIYSTNLVPFPLFPLVVLVCSTTAETYKYGWYDQYYDDSGND